MNKLTVSISCLLLLLVSILTLLCGDLPLKGVINQAILKLLSQTGEWNALLDERLPRLIVLICSGASLAVAGSVSQSLFHNPLASPSVLGISCGGSLFIIIVFAFNLHYVAPYAIPVSAVAGCMTTLFLIYLISKKYQIHSTQQLILTGIALSTLLIAIQAMIVYSLRDNWRLVQTLTEWQAGSSIDRSWNHVHMQMPLTITGLIGCLKYRREIDILALGDDEAINLGVDVEKVRWRLFFSIALLTGGALASMGIVTFFGLVLPHILRKMQGPSQTTLLPLCIILGASLLTLMDLSLRLLKIQALSIGTFSAVLGGFFFLILMFRSQKKSLSHA